MIVLIDLLTRPEKMEKLRKFYRMCRPPGFWAPVKGEIESGERKAIKKENTQDIIDCFLGAVFCVATVACLTTIFSRQFVLFFSVLSISVGSGSLFLLRWKKRGVFQSLSRKEEE